MRPAVATVLSTRAWEPAFVRLARSSALARVVGRAWEADTIDAVAPEVVVVGAETGWLGRGIVDAWQRSGRSVMGVHGSEVERRALVRVGVDQVAGDDDVEHLLIAACRAAIPPAPAAPLIVVSGPRGATGKSTVALAIARALPGATLVDGDPDPNLGPLLGLPPGPDHDELARALTGTSTVPGIHTAAGTRVLAPLGRLPDTVVSCLRAQGPVVLDRGPFPSTRLPRSASHTVFVVEATAVGLVRAAGALRQWEGTPPTIVLNRVPGDRRASVRACRAATGLEPGAVIPESDRPLTAADAALCGFVP